MILKIRNGRYLSQNNRFTEVGSDILRSSPAPLRKQVQLGQAAQDCVQSGWVVISQHYFWVEVLLT